LVKVVRVLCSSLSLKLSVSLVEEADTPLRIPIRLSAITATTSVISRSAPLLFNTIFPYSSSLKMGETTLEEPRHVDQCAQCERVEELTQVPRNREIGSWSSENSVIAKFAFWAFLEVRCLLESIEKDASWAFWAQQRAYATASYNDMFAPLG
jgi:hypothetical protein